MANLLLAVTILGLFLAWRRTSFRLPAQVRMALSSPRKISALAGFVVVFVTVGYSIGDVLSGRTQVSKSPVKYATRLLGPEAHQHDLVDPARFWRQVLLQTGAGMAVGVTTIALSRVRQNAEPQRV